jgi:type I restriction enzyme R subunit
LGDEIRSHKQKNLTQAPSFRDLLEKTLLKCHNRLIDAAAISQEVIEIRKELDKQHWRAEELGVSEEELAFLRRPSDNADNAYDD